ncbi:MAG: class I SAM-dependent methyltransferase [Parvibaculaceae bacterium]
MGFAPALGQKHVEGARLVPGRVAMLSLLPAGAVVCEVGVWEGEFSRKILEIAKPRTLHLVDMELHRLDRVGFAKELSEGRIILHEGDSVERLGAFPDETFDWIYVDADHRLDGVRRDVAVARRKVKRDGWLVFNDYIRWTRRDTEYGVIPAVNALIVEDGWRIVCIALSESGYHDVALRRIAP